MKIVIVNSGLGNVGAIPNMLKRLGHRAEVSRDPEVIGRASRIILPGVGSFDAAMRRVNQLGFVDVLNQKVLSEKVPVLGICLGMQLMAYRSEEGMSKGLGWVPGVIRKFAFSRGVTGERLRVPHMGWRIVNTLRKNGLFQGLVEPRYYFVHSYHFVCEDESNVAGTSDYGGTFVAAINHENVWGVQFHPEKSHRFGLALFENFLKC